MQELVIVKFKERAPGESSPGVIVLDAERRSKIAFVSDRALISNPGPGSVWRCLVTRDTESGDRRHGALIVEPIHFLTTSATSLRRMNRPLHDSRRRPIMCGTSVLQLLIESPQLARFVPDAITQLDVDMAARLTLTVSIDVGEVTGPVMWRKAPTIRAEEATTFAHVLGREHPVRVIIPEEAPRFLTTLWLRFGMSKKRHLFLNSLSSDKTPRRSPLYAETKKEEKARLGFWLEHAFIYNPDTMGKPFTASWKELLEYELDYEEHRPETEIRRAPPEERIPTLQ